VLKIESYIIGRAHVYFSVIVVFWIQKEKPDISVRLYIYVLERYVSICPILGASKI
jgi:hypothetical protein